MSLFVLDTDILTHLERGEPNVIENIRRRSASELATTVITIEQKLAGWHAYIRQARNPRQIVYGYESLSQAVILLRPLRILTLTMAAYDRYLQLQSLKLGVGKADLKIAAIALENEGIVVTKNLRDFRRVPSLTSVDWTLTDETEIPN